MGLEGVLAARAADLHGIVNGIDTKVWNPQTDAHLRSTYGPGSIKARAGNRQTVAEAFDLAQDDSMLFCVISRLTWQKGMDRSEEHTSELQSLMHNSYDVFCLKKK